MMTRDLRGKTVKNKSYKSAFSRFCLQKMSQKSRMLIEVVEDIRYDIHSECCVYSSSALQFISTVIFLDLCRSLHRKLQTNR